MSRKHFVLPFVAALAAIVIAGCATTQRGPAEWDGLVRQPNTRLDAVFLKPDAEIPSYTSNILAPATVQFARNWDPKRGGRSLVEAPRRRRHHRHQGQPGHHARKHVP